MNITIDGIHLILELRIAFVVVAVMCAAPAIGIVLALLESTSLITINVQGDHP